MNLLTSNHKIPKRINTHKIEIKKHNKNHTEYKYFYILLFKLPFILEKHKQSLAAALHQTTALEKQEGRHHVVC